ncbi:DUF2637 domain-containing protein [Aeromicrobium piscarium]|uniref:DUF2637 domain-containing protein n=1 Tax=Aeromicrobium piscarium TaxID=2590901 RepID=UPI001FE57034|nr:DUF2637 domain-containing protein [Aeromicrobium piscarium]
MVIAVAGTVAIGCGAFWLSFMSLTDLALRSGIGSGQAWVWPLIVDGIIVVSTVAVVALDGQSATWYPWALLIGAAAISVTANSLHAIVAAEASVPGLLAAAVAAIPPVVLLASTHLTVILTRPPAGVDYLSDKGHWVEPTELVQSSTAAPPPTGKAPRPAATSGPAGSKRDRRERARELREKGWSNKRIAREFDVHAATVGRWFAREHRENEGPTTDPMESERTVVKEMNR